MSSTRKSSMRLAPLRPARTFAQVASTPQPRGLTMPIPVTTTRRSSIVDDRYTEIRGRSADRLGQEGDGVTEGLDGLGGVIGNLDRKLFLEGHHQFDLIE